MKIEEFENQWKVKVFKAMKSESLKKHEKLKFLAWTLSSSSDQKDMKVTGGLTIKGEVWLQPYSILKTSMTAVTTMP